MIEAVFVPFCIEEQNILGTEEGMEKFLQIISDDEDRQELKAFFGQCSSSKDRWDSFVKYVKNKKTTVFYNTYETLTGIDRNNLISNV